MILHPARSSRSLTLDQRTVPDEDGQDISLQEAAPYVAWPDFYRALNQLWRPGPPDWPNSNIAIVGTAGSGKTRFTREIVKLRERVCVFGTKTADPSLYEPLQREGFRLQNDWNPEDTRQPKVIFRPPLTAPTPAALAGQRAAFQSALLHVFQVGGWTLWFDEVRYLSETLKLSSELNLLWLQGRSLGVTIVALTQRPVSVPINMFEQSRFLVTFRVAGREDRRTMANYAGASAPVVFETAAVLPKYELLLVDSESDLMMRTRVE